MNPVDIIQTLWRLGYFFSPEALKIGLITEGDLDVLTLEHPIVKAAVRAYQKWFQPILDQFTLRATAFGGFERPSIADGDAGPNTIEVMTLPRCGVPDFKHPLAVQEANWPDSCRMEITTSYQMTLKGLNAEQIRAGRLLAIANINKALEVTLTLNLDAYPNTRLWTVPEPMTGSILAYHYFPTNNCNSRAKGAFNSNVTWNEALHPATDTHEMLHGLGLDHVNNSAATMYSQITNTSMARKGALHEADLAEAQRKGYKIRTTPIPPPVPPTPGPVPPGIHQLVIQSASPIKIIDKPDWFS